MDDLERTRACPACATMAGPSAAFCSQCGARLVMAAASHSGRKWYYSVWFVLVMLTPFALGPFALPLLWKSPQFSKRAKVVLTLLALIATIWLIWYLFVCALPRVREWTNQLNGALQM